MEIPHGFTSSSIRLSGSSELDWIEGDIDLNGLHVRGRHLRTGRKSDFAILERTYRSAHRPEVAVLSLQPLGAGIKIRVEPADISHALDQEGVRVEVKVCGKPVREEKREHEILGALNRLAACEIDPD